MTTALVLVIYGALTAAGSVMGYMKAKSNGLLAAGIMSGAALIASGLLMLSGLGWGFYVGLTVNVLLIILLGRRYARTKAVMPSGMMLGISVVVAGVLFTELFP